jgi:CubicO group peptidase (beta-lactamase class C family)
MLAAAVLAVAPLTQGYAATDDDQGAAEKSAPEDPQALRAKIRTILEEHEAPAAGVAVVEDGSVTMAEGFGVADRADDREATDRTLFRLGSVSKSFVGLAVLELRERGELKLREEVRQVAPKLPLDNPFSGDRPVRMAHLLEHTAGLPDLGLAGVTQNAPDVSLLEALTTTQDMWQSRWRPGTYFAYSNIGPTMAAYIVEQRVDGSFEAFTDRTIFEPLGMESAVWQPSEAEMERMATGYRADGETAVPFKHLLVRPAGNLSMSPTDMGTFLRLMSGRGEVDGRRLFEPGSIARSEVPETTLAAKNGLETGYGLGNVTRGTDGYLLRGHDGGMVGFQASYRYVPNETGFAVSINASDAAAMEELKSTLTSYITRKLQEPEPAPTAEVDPDKLERLTGYYQPMALRHDWALAFAEPQGVIRVTREGGELQSSPLLGAESTRLIPTGERTFRTPESPKATTVFLESGKMQRNLAMGTANYRPVSGLVAWGRLVGLGGSLLAVLTAVLFSLVWVPRRMFGNLESPRLSARGATAFASWMLVAWVGALVGATGSAWIQTLGTVNPWSVAIAVLSGLFGLAGIGAVGWTTYVEWTGEQELDDWGPWLAAWHTRIVAAALAFLVSFLAYYELLGLRTWQL